MATVKELQEQLAQAQAKIASLTAPKALSLKVSEKGAVSLYGINSRFPVTLYAEQWERVLDHSGQIKEFIRQNSGKLSRKG